MPDDRPSRPPQARPSYTDKELSDLLKAADPTPRRHYTFTTSKFIFGTLAQTIVFAFNAFMTASLYQQGSALSVFVTGLLVAAVLINIACVVALFLHRRLGFYGLAVISVVVFVLNLCTGVGPSRGLTGLLIVAALYWILTRGGEGSLWRQLK